MLTFRSSEYPLGLQNALHPYLEQLLQLTLHNCNICNNGMDRIDAMQAFVAVADLRGFAPAARKLRPVAFGRDAADRGAGGPARRAAAAADHAAVTLTDAGSRYLERARRILADVEEAEELDRGRAHAAGRPAGGLGAGRVRPAACQSRDVGLPEALSRGRRRPAAVGPHDQPGRRRRRSRRPDRPSAGFDPGGAPCRRDAADRGGFDRLSQGARRAEDAGRTSPRTTPSSSAP